MTFFELVAKRVNDLRGTSHMGKSVLEIIEWIYNTESEKSKLFELLHYFTIVESEEDFDNKLNQYREDVKRQEDCKSETIADAGQESGYIPQRDGKSCYALYYNGLISAGKLSHYDLDRVHSECSNISNRFFPYSNVNPDRRGLVIGQVQSGKTTIFNGLIAIAADLGYNLIIILSGTLESLRLQTQKRIDNDVVQPWNHSHNTSNFNFRWISNHNGPGLSSPTGNPNTDLPNIGNNKNRDIAVGVFLKNATQLETLRKYLDKLSTLLTIRALVIDDEADQATPNGGVSKDTITAINQAVKNVVLLNSKKPCVTQKNTTYLGFTATPFANLLNEIGVDTLYPKDFIYFLKSSPKYYGPYQLFGNPEELEGEDKYIPLNVIRLLKQQDVDKTSPRKGIKYRPEVSGGLRDAIYWYILAATARRIQEPNAWVTMLVHTSSKIQDHNDLGDLLRTFFKKIKKNPSVIVTDLKSLWDSETKKVTIQDFNNAFPDYGSQPSGYPVWSDIEAKIVEIIPNIEIKIDNSDCRNYNERLKFDENEPSEKRLQIGIGGNTLSRGITLEGLVSSYFARTVSAYDTLLQMGRWFGYRKGYEILIRLWTTEPLIARFRDLVTMEKSLKDQMQLYLAGTSPADKAPVIRMFPAMAITRKNVINKNIKTLEVDYSGQAPQITMYENNKAILQDNYNLTLGFLNKIRNAVCFVNNKIIYKNVNFTDVAEYLEKFNVCSSNIIFNVDLINDFIHKNKDEYKEWSVVVMGGSSKENFELEQGIKVSKNNRTRISDANSGLINLKSLRSTTELLADMTDQELNGEISLSASQSKIWEFRKRKSLNPVLIIYPIDKNSKPAKNSNRFDLDAEADIIGLSLIMSSVSEYGGNKAVCLDTTNAYPSKNDEDDNDF